MGDLYTIDRPAAYNTAFHDRPGFPKLANITVMASESGRPSGPSNPGIIITWKPRLIHVALGQLGSLVPQGPDVITSLERFEHYIYGEIVRTPLSEVQNCVVDPLVAPGRFCNLFHRLPKTIFSTPS